MLDPSPTVGARSGRQRPRGAHSLTTRQAQEPEQHASFTGQDLSSIHHCEYAACLFQISWYLVGLERLRLCIVCVVRRLSICTVCIVVSTLQVLLLAPRSIFLIRRARRRLVVPLYRQLRDGAVLRRRGLMGWRISARSVVEVSRATKNYESHCTLDARGTAGENFGSSASFYRVFRLAGGRGTVRLEYA